MIENEGFILLAFVSLEGRICWSEHCDRPMVQSEVWIRVGGNQIVELKQQII